MILFKLIELYATRMLKLFTQGPDKIVYDPVKEALEIEEKAGAPDVADKVDTIVYNSIDKKNKVTASFFDKNIPPSKILSLPKQGLILK